MRLRFARKWTSDQARIFDDVVTLVSTSARECALDTSGDEHGCHWALPACLRIQVTALPVHAADLMVAAASSLTNAFTEIGKAYEQARPGTRVLFNFGASGQLLQQISRGAPVDVFASADIETMDRAEQAEPYPGVLLASISLRTSCCWSCRVTPI